MREDGERMGEVGKMERKDGERMEGWRESGRSRGRREGWKGGWKKRESKRLRRAEE